MMKNAPNIMHQVDPTPDQQKADTIVNTLIRTTFIERSLV